MKFEVFKVMHIHTMVVWGMMLCANVSTYFYPEHASSISTQNVGNHLQMAQEVKGP
jgi:hypothetical protein